MRSQDTLYTDELCIPQTFEGKDLSVFVVHTCNNNNTTFAQTILCGTDTGHKLYICSHGPREGIWSFVSVQNRGHLTVEERIC